MPFVFRLYVFYFWFRFIIYLLNNFLYKYYYLNLIYQNIIYDEKYRIYFTYSYKRQSNKYLYILNIIKIEGKY